MGDFANVRQVLHAEGVLLFPQERVDALVKTFGVQAINFCRIHAQRAIDKDRDARQLTGQGQLVQRIDDLLCAADRESRDDNFALAVESLAHELSDFFVRVMRVRMLASAIGALDLQIIDIFHWLRVAQDVVIASANVAAEKITKLACVFANVQYHLGGAQDMACVAKGNRHAISNWKGTIIVDGNKLPDSFFGISGGVERLDRRQAVFGAFLGDKGRIVALDLGRVFEHDAGQVARGKSAVDVAIESLAAKVGEVAAMIDMRMAENHGIDGLGIEREVAIALDRFLAFSLE